MCGTIEVLSVLVEVEGNESPAGVVKGSCHDLVKQLINHHLYVPRLNCH